MRTEIQHIKAENRFGDDLMAHHLGVRTDQLRWWLNGYDPPIPGMDERAARFLASYTGPVTVTVAPNVGRRVERGGRYDQRPEWPHRLSKSGKVVTRR